MIRHDVAAISHLFMNFHNCQLLKRPISLALALPDHMQVGCAILLFTVSKQLA